MTLSRREFVQLAAAMGASLAWTGPARASRSNWREARDLYPEGVASGDPDPNSIILWTRRTFAERRTPLADCGSRRGRGLPPGRCESSGACVGGIGLDRSGAGRRLKPAHDLLVSLHRSEGNGSRIGRTITAPRPNDPRPVKFAFVSCQDVNESKLNGYRRMIFEDERARPENQLDFVLHLGDFIYEVVQYPGGRRSPASTGNLRGCADPGLAESA